MKEYPLKTVVICDLDGTLCDVDHRRHLVMGDRKYFDEFNAALVHDNIRQVTMDLLKEYMSIGKTIVFLSGRSERYRQSTVEWLEKNGLKDKYEFLDMRPDDDSRPDDVLKEQIFHSHFTVDQIYKVIDDRPKVVRMWQRLGLDVIDVGDGIDF